MFRINLLPHCSCLQQLQFYAKSRIESPLIIFSKYLSRVMQQLHNAPVLSITESWDLEITYR